MARLCPGALLSATPDALVPALGAGCWDVELLRPGTSFPLVLRRARHDRDLHWGDGRDKILDP